MIQDQTTKVIYVGNGQTTHFPFRFKYNKKTDISVAIYDMTTNIQTDLTKDFFVDTKKNEVIYPGYQTGQEPPEAQRPPILQSNQKLVIYRKTPITQETDFGTKYPLPIVESATDKNVMIIQELNEQIDRCVKISIAEEDDIDSQKIQQMLAQMYKARDEAEKSADSAEQDADRAEQIKNDVEKMGNEYTEQAEQSAIQAGNYAKQAEQSALAVAPEAYDSSKTYSFPDVVAYTDGETYRCIGQNITGENPFTSPNWVRIESVVNDFWVIDGQGDLTPNTNPTYSAMFKLDSNGDITFK